MHRIIPLFASLSWATTQLAAQQVDPPDKLALNPPGTAKVSVTRNIPFRGTGDSALTFDLYRSPRQVGPRPAFMVFNVIGRNFKNDPLNTGWARLAATQGFTGIVYQVVNEAGAVAAFDDLLAYLAQHARTLRVQPDTVVIWAGSTNARVALPTASDSARSQIKALILYYGAGTTPAWRRDLPTLVVRAGLDQPFLHRLQAAMVDSMMTMNLPVTLINHPFATHPFEADLADSVSKDVIRATFAFARTALTRPVREALAANALVAEAAAALLRQDWEVAVRNYQRLHRERGADFNLTQRLGDALLGAGRFAEAGAVYDEALAQGSWRRAELALGAIAAYAQAGELERAGVWLERIPPNWTTELILSRIGAAANVPGLRGLIEARGSRRPD